MIGTILLCPHRYHVGLWDNLQKMKEVKIELILVHERGHLCINDDGLVLQLATWCAAKPSQL